MDDFEKEDARVRDAVWMIERCRDLGGIDLDRQKRTIGFERRPLNPDRSPRTGAAWGVMPREYDD